MDKWFVLKSKDPVQTDFFSFKLKECGYLELA